MVHKCCISSCGMSVRVVGAKGLSYHAFPVKEPNRDKWLQAILPHVEKPELFRIVQGYTRICSRHFKKKDYSIDSKKRARLSSNAVPSVFPGRDIKDSSLPIKIECIETGPSVTISPREKLPTLTLVKEEEVQCRLFADMKSVQFGTLDSFNAPFDATTSAIDQPLPLSEDDTASSTFSSQEECYISPPPLDQLKGNGKIRKRRKHRNISLPPPSNSSKKRSSASEDLNIEGVGDALAEINLSALISASSDLKKEVQCGSGEMGLSSTSLDNAIGDNELVLGPVVKLEPNQSRLSKRSLPNAEEESIVASLDSFSLKKDNLDQQGFEQELLMSIQAVTIGPNESIQPPPLSTTPETESRHPFMAADVDDSLVSNHLHDLYAELVNGGASLSLEDSSAAIFDSQVLIDALQSVTDDLQAGASIDQLARDLSDSFLDVALSPSMLNLDEIRDSDFVTFTTNETISNFGSETTLLTSVPLVPQDNPDNTAGGEDGPLCASDSSTILKQAELESPNKRSKEDSDSCPELDETSSKARKKSTKKEKSGGSFSLERFRDSDKDIEYYTGFQTFEKFDEFFRSIDSYVENLRVTDMVHGVASIGLTSPSQDSNGGGKIPGETFVDTVLDEPKRRLSQGRSMSRMDEMFMTVMRLRRKIPEKVIGHMFCISQPSVSRIIRAWTMLLSKILELQCEEKPGCGIVSGSGGQERPKGVQENIQLGLPSSFRQLFHSDLAQSIICTGNAALNSRKTSCSTACPNSSRSKRPKKEKMIVIITEQFPAPTSTTAEDVPKPDSCPYSISPLVAGEISRIDKTVGSVVPLVVAAAPSGEI